MSEENEQLVKPKSTSTERMRAKRARDKAAQVSSEEKAKRESAVQQLLDEVYHLDKEGKRHKSEARSYTRLVRLYFGQPEIGDVDNDEDDETSSSKASKKSKGPKNPNPSATRIRIQNSDIDPTQGGRGKRRRSVEDISYEVDDVVGFWRWLELRDRARKDLFWLGRLHGKGLYRSVHQITCDQFVPKNFGGPWLNQDGTVDHTRPVVEPMYFEGYSLDDFHDMIDDQHQWREKEMMLLDSRGYYKSTINGVDAAQWLLNCP